MLRWNHYFCHYIVKLSHGLWPQKQCCITYLLNPGLPKPPSTEQNCMAFLHHTFFSKNRHVLSDTVSSSKLKTSRHLSQIFHFSFLFCMVFADIACYKHICKNSTAETSSSFKSACQIHVSPTPSHFYTTDQ